LFFREDSSLLTVFEQEIREETENRLTQRRKGAKVKTDGIAAKRRKKRKKEDETKIARWFRALRGTEPPSRYWPANLTKRPSQREALSGLV
jgi:hypothetical protein